MERAFQSAENDQQKDAIQAQLKNVLTDVAQNGKANSIDWDKRPLP